MGDERRDRTDELDFAPELVGSAMAHGTCSLLRQRLRVTHASKFIMEPRNKIHLAMHSDCCRMDTIRAWVENPPGSKPHLARQPVIGACHTESEVGRLHLLSSHHA